MAWFVDVDGNVTGPHGDGAVVDGIEKKFIPPRARISRDQESWTPLASQPVFAAALEQAGVVVVHVQAAPVMMRQMAYPSPYEDDLPIPTGTSGMAIAGFVLSLFCAPLGLIFSWIAIRNIDQGGNRQEGRGLAMAGVIISILVMCVGVLRVAAS